MKAKAQFIFKHRHLIVKRRENLTRAEVEKLAKMLFYHSELRTLRKFMDKVCMLLSADQTRQQAGCRRKALVSNESFLAIPELEKAIAMLSKEKFDKIVAFLHSPANQVVRTNNHVERANRKLRFYEKVRYKWRRRRSIIRYLLLAITHWFRLRPKSRGQPRIRSPENAGQTGPRAPQSLSA